MYRYSNGQISLSDFNQPAGMNLKEKAIAGVKRQTIPWLDIENAMPSCSPIARAM